MREAQHCCSHKGLVKGFVSLLRCCGGTVRPGRLLAANRILLMLNLQASAEALSIFHLWQNGLILIDITDRV